MVAIGSAARETSADVPPIDLGQDLRGEMMGCSLEVGEDAERKRGGSLSTWVWELFLSVPPPWCGGGGCGSTSWCGPECQPL